MSVSAADRRVGAFMHAMLFSLSWWVSADDIFASGGGYWFLLSTVLNFAEMWIEKFPRNSWDSRSSSACKAFLI